MKFLLAIPLVAALAWGQDTLSEYDGFHAKMDLEYGHLVKGEFRRDIGTSTASDHLKFVALNRNIISLKYGMQSGENWSYVAGLKGILWWPFSTEIGEPGTRTVRVEPQLSILKAKYAFDTEKQSFLEFGFFPYKYNPDARNLGEYLYKSGTYPADVNNTDGYQLIDHAYYDAYGLHARWANFGGVLNHDFNLFSEGFVEPIGDLTPAYQLTLNFSRLQIGGGAAYNRGISFHPSRLRPKDEDNLYIEVPADSAKGYAYYKGPYLGAPSAVRDDPTKPYTVVSRWTQRGLKLMGRASLDLGDLLPEDKRSPEDLRLYAEFAVLGLENQPYYYEHLNRRIPVMFGVNLPTFSLLDLLTVEAEYYNHEFNNVLQYDRISVPVWTVGNFVTKDLDTYTPSKWRWSVYGQKSLNRLFDLHFQIASDHLRLRNVLSTRSDYELTPNPKNWYYLVKAEVGI